MYNKRVSLISFFAMWMVVVWHSYCGSSIEQWFLPLFCYWSVPWFFCVSGYFLFQSFDKRGGRNFLKRKGWTLVLPYFLWCAIGAIIYMVLSPCPVDLSITRIFALQNEISPSYNRPLWYVRTLSIFLAMSCAILVILKRLAINGKVKRPLAFSFLFVPTVCFVDRLGLRLGPASSSLYFLLGVWFSEIQGISIIKSFRGHRKYLTALTVFALVSFATFRGFWFYAGHKFSDGLQGGTILGNLSTLSLIMAIVIMVNIIGEGHISKILGFWGEMASFVYFFHRPLLTCMINRLDSLLPNSTAIRNFEFLGLALLYAPFCVAVAVGVKHFMPKVYYSLTGGRG